MLRLFSPTSIETGGRLRTQADTFNPDSAAEIDTCIPVKGRAWRSEGIEANNFNAVYGASSKADNFSGVRCSNGSLQAATSHRPIVFAPEGSPLDRRLILNSEIRIQVSLSVIPGPAAGKLIPHGLLMSASSKTAPQWFIAPA
jgi:hypothetical protein